MLKPNVYAVLSRCVHDGVNQGMTEAILDKSITNRSVDDAKENIHLAIMREITEYFDIQDGNE